MLKLFTIKDEFIDYLQKFDSRVLSNKYIGFIHIKIGNPFPEKLP